jgi:polyisoprenoid-binding protein YceI
MMMTNLRGGFTGVQGTIDYNPENPNESRIEVIIDASKINTLLDTTKTGHRAVGR